MVPALLEGLKEQGGGCRSVGHCLDQPMHSCVKTPLADRSNQLKVTNVFLDIVVIT
jgi:hypothetical protein